MKTEILKALVYISVNGPVDKTSGICRNVFECLKAFDVPPGCRTPRFEREVVETLHEVFEGWKHNTGNYAFPIPGKNSRANTFQGGYQDYRDNASKAWKRPSKIYKFFFPEMTYSELRYDLLEYSIKKLEKELKNV